MFWRCLGLVIGIYCLVAHSCAIGQESNLSPTGLFHRCYGQLVRARVPANDSRLAAIEDGSLDPVDACIRLLEDAAFSDLKPVENPSEEVRSVLRTMHDFHASWFFDQSYEGNLFSGCEIQAIENLIDPTAPAAYITRALFNPMARYEDVMRTPLTYRPVRSTTSPTVSARLKQPKVPYLYDDENGETQSWEVPYAPQGELIGVEPNGSLILPRSARTYHDGVANHDLYKNFGSGAIGDPAYMLMTIRDQVDGFRAQGALEMPRRWSRSLLKDFLCRDLPVIRRGDGIAFARVEAQAPFRRSNSCIQCHASMDRLAATNRNILYSKASNRACDASTPILRFMFPQPVTLPAKEVWPIANDYEYSKRPPEGVLYYRSYNGQLVHRKVLGVSGAANAIADNEDYYVCAAKRYYEFFTGIKADLRDIGDPLEPIFLNKEQLDARKTVVDLGLNLKQHQSLKSLVRQILSSANYRKVYFGHGGKDEEN
ncbi:MAG: hypothetical protein AB7G93_07375 [Bdellovibrionales bacterium]